MSMAIQVNPNRILFDESLQRTWGKYMCECGAEYFPRGIQNHKPGCVGNAVYHFGMTELDAVLQSRDGRTMTGDLTRQMLDDSIGELPLELQIKLQGWKKR